MRRWPHFYLSGKEAKAWSGQVLRALSIHLILTSVLWIGVHSLEARASLSTSSAPESWDEASLRNAQGLLPEDTILLLYELRNRQSSLWLVSSESILEFELPSRESIVPVAMEYWSLLSEGYKKSQATQTKLKGVLLSKMILRPAAGHLGKAKLVIVPDAPLQIVPFADLSGLDGQPLIRDHEIVVLPSGVSPPDLQQILRQRTERSDWARPLAVLADPVFSREDPRLEKSLQDPPASVSGESASGLRRLPHTSVEAAGILSLLPRGEAFVAVGFDADRETLFNLSKARILHFATHAILEDSRKSSGIVLSTVNRGGFAQDGFVTADEIDNLDLQATELVVLSACDSARGQVTEGVDGLTRSFITAGSKWAVGSVWNVNDEATKELMIRFYSGMLKGHLSPSAALRAAQLSMLENSRWREPYFWAGFILQGGWGSISSIDKPVLTSTDLFR